MILLARRNGDFSRAGARLKRDLALFQRFFEGVEAKPHAELGVSAEKTGNGEAERAGGRVTK